MNHSLFQFGAHCKNRFESTTRITHEFLETIVGSEKAHISSTFSKNKLKLREVQRIAKKVRDLKPKLVSLLRMLIFFRGEKDYLER